MLLVVKSSAVDRPGKLWGLNKLTLKKNAVGLPTNNP